ncbi:hypothetical protein OB2597_00270 [Pseudooceanicola batsensis HTCC2597]|uniref:DUF5337 domain-containing protein n=1 Tax=Pseudooceanicola batsensis (strain ATCC BAA-863 / DSM 15984 / KCTC 12145 / HTCC2597) TaxID=252305 RepID=A3U1M4_PSEBH|nr:DUF5337 domain-containing protein [Pseudooceanicola batsensis]EAQ01805.1 hypothetical protein OB2597_00270 [Pseudooceanicola batsensis HTCC2597]
MTKRDDAIARKGRIVALVIAGAMMFWIGGQFLRSELDMPLRFAFLIDFIAIAAFIWALVVAAQIWRARRDDEG